MATIYTRIANPYQPNGTAGLANAPTPFYAPGEIGGAYNDQSTGRAYVRVKLDSGATSATPAGAVAANQLAFWKDRSAALVTNDKRMADVGLAGSVNRVAGVFQTAVSTAPGINGTDGQPLQYICDVLIQGLGVSLLSSDNTGVAGAFVLSAASGVATAATVGVANVTTAPITQNLGVLKAVPSANLAIADVTIGFVL